MSTNDGSCVSYASSWLVATFLLLACFVSCPTGAEVVSTVGNDFIISFLRNVHDANIENNVELHISSNEGAVALVEYPLGNTLSFEPIPIGETLVLPLPINVTFDWDPGSWPQSNSVRVLTFPEGSAVTVHMVNRANLTSDASLAIPIDAMGTSYVLLDSSTDDPTFPPEFVVTAVHDNTQVNVTPSGSLVGTGSVPISVLLNRGESYYGSGLVASGSGTASTLTGTKIDSSEPIAVTNGVLCGKVPLTANFCDHMFEMAPPVVAWGKFYMAAPSPLPSVGTSYRIVAAEGDTFISTTVLGREHGSATLNAGEFLDIEESRDKVVFVSDSPILVAQFISSKVVDSDGDSSMVNVIPPRNFLLEHAFATASGFDNHYVSIVCRNEDVGLMTIDGVAIPAVEFSPFGETGFSSAALQIAEGNHTTQSTFGGHGITVEGYAEGHTYMFSGSFQYGTSTDASAQGEVVQTTGSDFILSFLRNIEDPSIENYLELHISTAESPIEFFLEYPVGERVIGDLVGPGATYVLPLPVELSFDWDPGNWPQSNSLRVLTLPPENGVTVHMVNRASFSSDASLAIPVDAIGTSYVIVDSSTDDPSFPPEFVVTAVHDNTQVNVTPSGNLSESGTSPISVSLNRGESYYGSGLMAGGNGTVATLTGTRIESSLSVVVTNGVLCANVPFNASFCDHMFEMAPPVSSWSTLYLAAAHRGAPFGTSYRVVAISPDTTVRVSSFGSDDDIVARLGPGEMLETDELASDVMIVGSHPIMVVQFRSSKMVDSDGDASMVNVVPPPNYLESHIFATVDGFDSHYVSIICRNGDVGVMTLDGEPIPPGVFSAMGSTGYSSAVLEITPGTHRTRSSTGGHGITIEGTTLGHSYLYSGGFQYNLIKPAADTISFRLGQGSRLSHFHTRGG